MTDAEAAQPVAPPRSFAGSALRGLAGALCAAALLVALWKGGFLRGELLAEAWRSRRELVWTMVALQLGVAALSVIRYHAVLRAAGASVPLRESAAATLVSLGVAQWLPASAGVCEVLRIGLMCGADVANREGLLARISVASLLDRTMGFAVVFLVGAAAALSLAIGSQQRAALSLVAAGFLAVAVALSAALGLLVRTRESTSPTALAPIAAARGPLRRVRAAAALLRRHAVRPVALVAPAWAALLVFLLLTGILRAAIRAVGGEASFGVVATVLPALTVAGLLPVSVGGLGGQQVASVGLLRLLGCDPVAVASAGLLNAAVVLGVHTVLALVFAGVSYRQLTRLAGQGRGAQRKGSCDGQR